MTYFHRVRGAMAPSAPPLDPLLNFQVGIVQFLPL